MTSPVSGRPLPSSFDDNEEFYNESGFQKVMRRMKREPLIPLGCLLTVAAFTNAYRAMRRGDHNQVQRMFRARVLAQAFTIVAIVAGGLYFGAERHKERELWKLKEEEKAEENRQKWIKELEARDDEEKELKSRLDKRRARKEAADAREAARDNFRAAQEKATAAQQDAASQVEAEKKEKEASGWGFGTLLGGSNKPASEKVEESKADPTTPKK